MAKQYFEIELPPGIPSDEKDSIAEEIINYIIKRTRDDGLDKNGKAFKKYTKEYASKKGVGVGDVDLTLTSEMLDELDYTIKNRRIKIGYTKASAELNGKVEGNITGSYGGDPNPSKARDFLGITDSELENILSKYGEDILKGAPQIFARDDGE